MQKPSNYSPTFFHLPELENINGVRFTLREIDIIACLLNGRSQKAVANLLTIAPRTVETHTRNILLKIEGSSRDSIINFIERAGKASLLRNHYQALLVRDEFERHLKIISTKISNTPHDSHMFYEADQEYYLECAHQFKGSLSLCGLKVKIISKESRTLLSNIMFELESTQENYNIYIVSSELIRQFQKKNPQQQKSDKDKTRSTKAPIFILPPQKELEGIQEDAHTIIKITDDDTITYYLCFFELLKNLYPALDLEETILTFKKQADLLYDRYEGQNINQDKQKLFPKEELSHKKLEVSQNTQVRIPYLANILTITASILTIVALFFGFFSFKGRDETHIKIADKTKTPQPEKMASIRSDLNIPSEASFLNRPEYMAQINEKFKGQSGIQTVALVGPGGAGKTTLARQYAHQQKSSIIWEINAETHESLKGSFENLAQALAKTQENKNRLRELQKIKDPTEREEKIIEFVKACLRAHSSWFLIFDNVEKFSDIQKHFPQDYATWGQGKVILTTRDSNIENNAHVGYTIQIGELNPNQKLSLFMKIVAHGNPRFLNSAHIREHQDRGGI